MEKNMSRKYKEVMLDGNETEIDRNYCNPLAKTFQYEYALYTVVSELFASIRCRSLCVNSLKLYFSELSHGKRNSGTTETVPDPGDERRRRTQEDLLDEMRLLLARDVIGHVIFPQINICAAEVRTIPEKDGTHSFVFTDGIYGFRLRLRMEGKNRPVQIMVTDLFPGRRKGGEEEKENTVHITGIML